MIRSLRTYLTDEPSPASGSVVRRAVVVALASDGSTDEARAEVVSAVGELVGDATERGCEVRADLAPGDALVVGGTAVTLVDAPRVGEVVVLAWRTGPVHLPALQALTAGLVGGS